MKTIKIDSDFTNIINLLTGDQFSDSKDGFLRELISNAYDACHVRQALEWSWGTEFLEIEEAQKVSQVRKTFDPKIVISYNSETGMLFVEDNGIGINEYDLEHYVASVGASYYTSEQYKMQRLSYEPISQFGIGLLSCFKVSRAILIESKKHRCINTAWNVMDRQSLEGIAAKWFQDADKIEYIISERTAPGTRVTLALLPKYAMNMSLKKLVKEITRFMPYQDIPIEIYFDKKRATIYRPKLVIEPSAYVAGITTLNIDNELLEGYITLYNSKHEHLVTAPQLYQQGFLVTEDALINDLKPSWLRHMSYKLNIKRRFLKYKLGRDAVANDENKQKLREVIGELIVGYFSKNPIGLSQYLVSGHHSIITEYENEMRLLENAANIEVYLKNQDIELTMGTVIEGFLGQKIRIAYIDKKLFDYFGQKFTYEYQAFLDKYNLIVFEKNREMFTQLITPYIQAKRHIISELPGVVYTEIVADIHMRKSVSPYIHSYELYPKNSVDDLIFCFVSNEQMGAFKIILNESNRNVELLEAASDNPKVANLREVIIENIKQRILNPKSHWDRIIDFGGSFVDEWTSDKPMSLQSVWCLEDDFAESLNRFVESKLTKEELLEAGLEGMNFHKEDFVDWWYMPR